MVTSSRSRPAALASFRARSTVLPLSVGEVRADHQVIDNPERRAALVENRASAVAEHCRQGGPVVTRVAVVQATRTGVE